MLDVGATVGGPGCLLAELRDTSCSHLSFLSAVQSPVPENPLTQTPNACAWFPMKSWVKWSFVVLSTQFCPRHASPLNEKDSVKFRLLLSIYIIMENGIYSSELHLLMF